MSRPPVEVTNILRIKGDCFREQIRSWQSYRQLNHKRVPHGCTGGHLDSSGA